MIFALAKYSILSKPSISIGKQILGIVGGFISKVNLVKFRIALRINKSLLRIATISPALLVSSYNTRKYIYNLELDLVLYK